MDPVRKRRIRLIAALTTAVLLASALIYTSFSAATDASTPSQLLSDNVPPNQQIDLTGKVAAGSVQRSGGTLRFAVRDRNGTAKVPVVYTGVVPDPFRAGRQGAELPEPPTDDIATVVTTFDGVPRLQLADEAVRRGNR